jgi:hypothetical protein
VGTAIEHLPISGLGGLDQPDPKRVYPRRGRSHAVHYITIRSRISAHRAWYPVPAIEVEYHQRRYLLRQPRSLSRHRTTSLRPRFQLRGRGSYRARQCLLPGFARCWQCDRRTTDRSEKSSFRTVRGASVRRGRSAGDGLLARPSRAAVALNVLQPVHLLYPGLNWRVHPHAARGAHAEHRRGR